MMQALDPSQHVLLHAVERARPWSGQDLLFHYDYDASGNLLESSVLDAQRTKDGWQAMPGLAPLAWRGTLNPMFCAGVPIVLENAWSTYNASEIQVDVTVADLAGNSVTRTFDLNVNVLLNTCFLPTYYKSNFVGHMVDNNINFAYTDASWRNGSCLEFDFYVDPGNQYHGNNQRETRLPLYYTIRR